MNHPDVDENSDPFWVGRLVATMTIAATALRAKNVSYARAVLDGELRDFRASPLACEEVMEILRKL